MKHFSSPVDTKPPRTHFQLSLQLKFPLTDPKQSNSSACGYQRVEGVVSVGRVRVVVEDADESDRHAPHERHRPEPRRRPRDDARRHGDAEAFGSEHHRQRHGVVSEEHVLPVLKGTKSVL